MFTSLKCKPFILIAAGSVVFVRMDWGGRLVCLARISYLCAKTIS